MLMFSGFTLIERFFYGLVFRTLDFTLRFFFFVALFLTLRIFLLLFFRPFLFRKDVIFLFSRVLISFVGKTSSLDE